MMGTFSSRLPMFEAKSQGKPNLKTFNQWKNLFKTGEYVEKDFDVIEDMKTFDYGLETKAGFSGVLGGGKEWQPETLGPEILTQVTVSSKVRNALRVIPTTSDGYMLGVDATAWTTKVSDPGVQGPASMPADTNAITGAVKFNHKKVAATTVLTSEFLEDATQQGVQEVSRSMAEALALAEEKDLFFQHATVGLENVAKDNTPGAGSENVVSEDALLDLIDSMPVQFLTNPQDLRLFVRPEIYRRMIRFQNFATLDKAGARATILTGMVGYFYGVPVYVTMGLSAPGTVFPALVVHTKAALIGSRRELRIKMFDEKGDLVRMEGTIRSDIQYPYFENTAPGVADGVVKENFKLA
jgi:HK97 family phage major capsid protein